MYRDADAATQAQLEALRNEAQAIKQRLATLEPELRRLGWRRHARQWRQPLLGLLVIVTPFTVASVYYAALQQTTTSPSAAYVAATAELRRAEEELARLERAQGPAAPARAHNDFSVEKRIASVRNASFGLALRMGSDFLTRKLETEAEQRSSLATWACRRGREAYEARALAEQPPGPPQHLDACPVFEEQVESDLFEHF